MLAMACDALQSSHCDREHVDVKAALCVSDQENAIRLIERAIESLRAAVDLTGNVPGIAVVSYRALGSTCAFLERAQTIPIVADAERDEGQG